MDAAAGLGAGGFGIGPDVDDLAVDEEADFPGLEAGADLDVGLFVLLECDGIGRVAEVALGLAAAELDGALLENDFVAGGRIFPREVVGEKHQFEAERATPGGVEGDGALVRQGDVAGDAAGGK